jgi:dipeptidyl aminopeptidase/acylaminoacyl peptidase
MRSTVLLLASCALAWPQAPSSWSPELSMRIQTVASVAPSPDGSRVAWTQSRAIMSGEESDWVSQIFLTGAGSSGPIQLTRHAKGAGSPQFSPDGRFLYFSSDRSGKTNLWRIPVGGGEPEMLTDWKGSLGGFKVSPCGRWVAFAAVEESAELEKAKKEKRDFRVIGEKPANHALWIVPAEGGKPKKAASGPWHIAAFDWSPDSRFLAFEHWPAPEADNWSKADISEVEIDSGKIQALAATAAAESDPHYSPDGLSVAFTTSGVPPRWPRQTRLAVVARASRERRLLSPTPDEEPALLGWTPDSSALLFTEARRTRRGVYAMTLDGRMRTLFEPAKGTFANASLNAAGTHAGLAIESSEDAPEAFVLNLAGGAPVRVSRANLDLAAPPVGETKLIRWKGGDGLEIEGLLTYPAAYQPGRKYPLILNIHGGPAGVFSETFPGKAGIYPLASFSSRGWFVLRPNPRGSGGYGAKFRFANVNDWGGGDYRDLMAGVDHVIAQGLADPDRMAVMGWSYGGFMTSWVITQTKRFKAAVIGAAVTDLASFTGTADIPGFLPDYFSGEPWENPESYRRHSPISHVKGVSTPALILHGEADVRVPTSQGYEYYNALKRQGATVKMVVYPRTPHGPREPKFQLDIMQRHIDWIEPYLR